ncbi:hypothetical protein CSC82_03780 [Rhodobacteraceae bacterium 4F10]|nr:hypothetical protein CSC82_03780 [Rhodobacteraceae bacterium 4F10]
MKKFLGSIALAMVACTPSLHAQSLSLEELAAKVDERAQMLGGYEDFLMDADPKRSMAALQVMLESGDDTLVSMALKHGLTSPNPDLKLAALKSYIAGKPSLGLQVVAPSVSEDQKELELLDTILKAHGGSLGANKTGSIVIALGEENQELGCFVRRVEKDVCAARMNATSVSIYLASTNRRVASSWFNLDLTENGQLTGSFTGSYNFNGSRLRTPLDVTISLID